MKRAILIKALIFLMLIAVGVLWFFNSYELKPVLQFPSMESNIFILEDTLVMDPAFYISTPTGFDVNINVEHLSDSIYFKTWNVSIASIDNPGQAINLTQVLAYKDTICNEDINQSYISAKKFDDLPDHYKSMSVKRDFNSVRFFFETSDVNQSNYYILTIAGTILYKGRLINFSKQIRAVRRKKFVSIQMMTWQYKDPEISRGLYELTIQSDPGRTASKQ